jgi:hypothetical protein
MTHGFLAKNSDMFRLIIWETSILGYGGELLEPLAGTPAADRLRANIDYQNQKAEKRRAYLEGQQGAYIETRNGFDVDGVEIKCRLDFGAKAIDWRGLYKNAGA